MLSFKEWCAENDWDTEPQHGQRHDDWLLMMTHIMGLYLEDMLRRMKGAE